jgi:hypothetical protein
VVIAEQSEPGGRTARLKLSDLGMKRVEELLMEISTERASAQIEHPRAGRRGNSVSNQRIEEMLITCRDALDAACAWQASAHVNQAIEHLRRRRLVSG